MYISNPLNVPALTPILQPPPHPFHQKRNTLFPLSVSLFGSDCIWLPQSAAKRPPGSTPKTNTHLITSAHLVFALSVQPRVTSSRPRIVHASTSHRVHARGKRRGRAASAHLVRQANPRAAGLSTCLESPRLLLFFLLPGVKGWKAMRARAMHYTRGEKLIWNDIGSRRARPAKDLFSKTQRACRLGYSLSLGLLWLRLLRSTRSYPLYLRSLSVSVARRRRRIRESSPFFFFVWWGGRVERDGGEIFISSPYPRDPTAAILVAARWDAMLRSIGFCVYMAKNKLAAHGVSYLLVFTRS